jgi:hypothetical protein
MSTRLLISGGAFAFVSVSSLLAQSSSGTPPAAQTGRPVAGVVASVTLTGCLERWSSAASPSPTGAPTEKAPAGAEFVLTQVAGQSESATSAGSGTTERADPKARYLLLPSPSMDFAAHLNHTVKVVGTIAPQPSEGASAVDHAINPSSSETNLPERPEAKAYQSNLIEVSSLTMVSRSCGK